MAVRLWDSPIKDGLEAIVRSVFRNMDGVAIVFDLSSKRTFERLVQWLKKVEDFADRGVCIVLIGNKSDAVRQISRDVAQSFAKNNETVYLETSCKEGINVEEALTYLMNLTYKKRFSAEANNEDRPETRQTFMLYNPNAKEEPKKKTCSC